MPDLNITLVQQPLVWEDISANLAAFEAVLNRMDGPTDLIVLPEMFTTGFSMAPAPIAETMDGSAVSWMRELAAEHQAVTMGSLIIKDGGKYFNRLVWRSPDGGGGMYDKRHRFRMAGEHEVYAGGDRLVTLEVNGWRIRPFVCYDLRFPAWTRNLGNTYDAAIFVANWPAPRAAHWRQLLRARAIENLSYVVGVNRIGTDGNGREYSGDSAAIAPDGKVLLEKKNEACSETVTLSRARLEDYRREFPAWKDADADLLQLPEEKA